MARRLFSSTQAEYLATASSHFHEGRFDSDIELLLRLEPRQELGQQACRIEALGNTRPHLPSSLARLGGRHRLVADGPSPVFSAEPRSAERPRHAAALHSERKALALRVWIIPCDAG